MPCQCAQTCIAEPLFILFATRFFVWQFSILQASLGQPASSNKSFSSPRQNSTFAYTPIVLPLSPFSTLRRVTNVGCSASIVVAVDSGSSKNLSLPRVSCHLISAIRRNCPRALIGFVGDSSLHPAAIGFAMGYRRLLQRCIQSSS